MVVFGADGLEGVAGVTFGESDWHSGMFACAPLKLKRVQSAVYVLQIVDFLLLLRAPEVTLAIETAVGIEFQTLANQIVLPQRAHVGA